MSFSDHHDLLEGLKNQHYFEKSNKSWALFECGTFIIITHGKIKKIQHVHKYNFGVHEHREMTDMIATKLTQREQVRGYHPAEMDRYYKHRLSDNVQIERMPPMTLSTSTSSTSSSSTSTSSTSTSSTSQQLAPTSKKRKATGSPSASTSVSKFELDLDGTAYFRETANRKDLWVISFTKPEDFVVLCGFAPIFRPETIKPVGKIVANFQDQEDAKNFIEYKINEMKNGGWASWELKN